MFTGSLYSAAYIVNKVVNPDIGGASQHNSMPVLSPEPSLTSF